jgi:hypothetical protein
MNINMMIIAVTIIIIQLIYKSACQQHSPTIKDNKKNYSKKKQINYDYKNEKNPITNAKN